LAAAVLLGVSPINVLAMTDPYYDDEQLSVPD